MLDILSLSFLGCAPRPDQGRQTADGTKGAGADAESVPLHRRYHGLLVAAGVGVYVAVTYSFWGVFREYFDWTESLAITIRVSKQTPLVSLDFPSMFSCHACLRGDLLILDRMSEAALNPVSCYVVSCVCLYLTLRRGLSDEVNLSSTGIPSGTHLSQSPNPLSHRVAQYVRPSHDADFFHMSQISQLQISTVQG